MMAGALNGEKWWKAVVEIIGAKLALGLKHCRMTQSTCPAGHTFSETCYPSPHSFWLLPDTGMESFIRHIIKAAKGGDPEGAIYDLIMDHGKDTVVCPECSRLFFLEHNRLIGSYVKE